MRREAIANPGEEMRKAAAKVQRPAGGAGEEPIDDHAFGAAGVNHAAGARAGKNGGDVLRADDESGEDGAVAELQVSVGGKTARGMPMVR